jgi:hypothetical protein
MVIHPKLFCNLTIGAIDKSKRNSQSLLSFFNILPAPSTRDSYHLSIKFLNLRDSLLQLTELLKTWLSSMVNIKNKDDTFPFKVTQVHRFVRDIYETKIWCLDVFLLSPTQTHENPTE